MMMMMMMMMMMHLQTFVICTIYVLTTTFSFILYRNPVTGGRNFTWEPVTANSAELAYLYITNSSYLEMRSSLDLGHREFWDSLPISEPQHNVNIPSVQQPKHHEL
jgi:hypothetical protein